MGSPLEPSDDRHFHRTDLSFVQPIVVCLYLYKPPMHIAFRTFLALVLPFLTIFLSENQYATLEKEAQNLRNVCWHEDAHWWWKYSSHQASEGFIKMSVKHRNVVQGRCIKNVAIVCHQFALLSWFGIDNFLNIKDDIYKEEFIDSIPTCLFPMYPKVLNPFFALTFLEHPSSSLSLYSLWNLDRPNEGTSFTWLQMTNC